MNGEAPVRTLVAWCPDWPVVAAGAGPGEAVAVVAGGAVLACSGSARAEGVRPGQRRREAQSVCPGLSVVVADEGRDARAFEAAARVLETLTPRVEVVRPGLAALPTRGPSRYFGGDAALAARAGALVGAALAGPAAEQFRVGVADGLFAATLAARAATAATVAARAATVVPPGAGAAFLAPLPVSALAQAPGEGGGLGLGEVAALLGRLGLATLGDVATVAPATLLGRFGPAGAAASRLARGLDERPVRPRTPPPDLAVSCELDPPAEQVEAAAFAARALASELDEGLAARGLACTVVRVEAGTAGGETLARCWRHDATLDPAALADRARWQLDGWLNGTAGQPPPGGGLARLVLVPEEVVAAGHRQLGFWGGEAAAGERAARGAARLQGMLGPGAVSVPRPRGGRGPAERVALVPAGSPASGAGHPAPEGAPWPGRVPAPSPAVVHEPALPAEVTDAAGRPVGVSGRGLTTAVPAVVAVAGGPGEAVGSWAGPWPADERWWDPGAHRRRVRLQVVTASGRAHLLVLEGGRWAVEGTYD